MHGMSNVNIYTWNDILLWFQGFRSALTLLVCRTPRNSTPPSFSCRQQRIVRCFVFCWVDLLLSHQQWLCMQIEVSTKYTDESIPFFLTKRLSQWQLVLKKTLLEKWQFLWTSIGEHRHSEVSRTSKLALATGTQDKRCRLVRFRLSSNLYNWMPKFSSSLYHSCALKSAQVFKCLHS